MRMNLTLENSREPPRTKICKRKKEHKLQSRHSIHDGDAPYRDGEQREKCCDPSERFVGDDQPFHAVRRGAVPVEYRAPVRGNGDEEKGAEDIGHARPKEPVDKARLLEDELDEDRGRAEKYARDDDETERIPREFEMRNQHR